MYTRQGYRSFMEELRLSYYFAFEWRREADWNFEAYCIPALTFWYVFSGKRRLLISGSETIAEPGSIIILRKNAVVSTSYDDTPPAPLHYLSLGIEASLGGIDWPDLYGMPVRLSLPPSEEMARLVEQWTELVRSAPTYERRGEEATESIHSAQHACFSLDWEGRLKLWLSLLTRLSMPFMEAPEPVTDKRVRDLCAYIRANYAAPVSSADLCRLLRISEAHMRMLFRRMTGMSPHQYLLHTRMDKAKELLLTTELSLQEVAEKVGFEGASYFISMFHRREGVTPAVFRRRGYIWETQG